MAFFDEVQAVLAGTRQFALDRGGMKLLYFMLDRSRGCDITVTPDGFRIVYGWHLSHHRYRCELAPQVVSWLCDAAPLGYLPAGTFPWWFDRPDDGERQTSVLRDVDTITYEAPLEPHWTYGAHRIWLDTSPACVVIKIRAATIDRGAGAFAQPLEPPIVYLAGEHPTLRGGAGALPNPKRRWVGVPRMREIVQAAGACAAPWLPPQRHPGTPPVPRWRWP